MGSAGVGLTASTYRSLACSAVGILFLIFVALPIAEIYVLVKVGSWLGVLPALALLLVVSALGAYVVKREGLRVFRRFQEQVAAGNMPSNEILDGVCLLLAGALLLVPGFVTDAIGLVLLLPPFRLVLRRLLKKRSGKKMNIVATYKGRIVNDGKIVDINGHIDTRNTSNNPNNPYTKQPPELEQ